MAKYKPREGILNNEQGILNVEASEPVIVSKTRQWENSTSTFKIPC